MSKKETDWLKSDVHFNSHLAEKHGIPFAFVLARIHHLINGAQKKGWERCFINERWWTDETQDKILSRFPFIRKTVLSEAFIRMKRLGFLLVEKRGKGFWYSLNYAAIMTASVPESGIDMTASVPESGIDMTASVPDSGGMTTGIRYTNDDISLEDQQNRLSKTLIDYENIIDPPPFIDRPKSGGKSEIDKILEFYEEEVEKVTNKQRADFEIRYIDEPIGYEEAVRIIRAIIKDPVLRLTAHSPCRVFHSREMFRARAEMDKSLMKDVKAGLEVGNLGYAGGNPKLWQFLSELPPNKMQESISEIIKDRGEKVEQGKFW